MSAATIFLQANFPVATPYCAGSHLWGSRFQAFAKGRPAVAFDLPGYGGGPELPNDPTFDTLVAAAAEGVRASSASGKVHLVGHDFAGLVALQLAMDLPQHVASLSIVSSAWAAPSGDGLETYTLSFPPQPLWSRASQAWAVERLCHSHLSVTPSLVDAMAAAAQSHAHRSALGVIGTTASQRKLLATATRSKFRFFQLARGEGLQVPVQVIAGQDDPLATPRHHLELFRIVGARQSKAHLHILNRCGAFPFLEQPDEFYRVLAAFHDGLAQEEGRAR